MFKMKKVFSMMLMLLVMSISMVSCSNDDEPENPANKIVGTWSQTNSYGVKIAITFNADETGYIKYTYETGNDQTEVFEYTYDATEHELYILGDDCQLSGSYDVVITATKLTLEGYANGDYGTYVFNKI